MEKIERSFVLSVPAEKVFSYMSNPIKVSEWLPSLFEIRDVVGMEANQQSSWTYKMMGIPLTGKAKCVEYIPNERIAIETTGNIRSSWTWSFKSSSRPTLVNIVIEYTIPVPVIGKLGDKLILRQNDREADLAIANLKERLEWRDQFKAIR